MRGCHLREVNSPLSVNFQCGSILGSFSVPLDSCLLQLQSLSRWVAILSFRPSVQQDDVSRAIDRAALLGRITGTPAVPLVIGTRTAEGVDLRTARLVTVPTEEELQAAGQEGAQA